MSKTYNWRGRLQFDEITESLKEIKRDAADADKLLSMIGDRKHLNQIIQYFIKLDDQIKSMSQSAEAMQRTLGDSLQKGFMTQLDNTFSRMSNISQKANNIFAGVGNIDLKKTGAKDSLKSYATDLNSLLADLGIDKKIDLQLFSKKSLAEQRQEIFSFAQNLNEQFGIVVGNAEAAFKSISKSMNQMSAVAESEIKKIEEHNKRLTDIKKKLAEVSQVVTNVKSKGVSAIPDEFGMEEVEITVENITKMLDRIDYLNQQITSGKLSADEYAQNLIQVAELTMKIQKAFSVIKSNDTLGNTFKNESGRDEKRDDNLYNSLRRFSGGSGYQYDRIIKANNDDAIGEIIDINTVSIENIKYLEQFTGVEEQLREIARLSSQLDNMDFDSPEYDIIEDKVLALKDAFIQLYKIQEDQMKTRNNFSIEDLGTDQEATEEVIAHFKQIIGVGDEVYQTTTSVSQGAAVARDTIGHLVDEAEYVKGIALQLEKLFDFAHKESTIEYKILINGQEIDIREGGLEEISLQTSIESWLANLDKNIAVDAHSHMGRSSKFNAPDLENAISRYYSGVASVSAIIGKNDISTLDLSSVNMTDAFKVLQKLKDMNVESISSKDLNKLFQDITGNSVDVVKTWNPSKFEDLAQFIFNIGKNADDASTYLDRFKNILHSVLPNTDISKYEDLFANFSKKNAADIFNRIMKTEGIDLHVKNLDKGTLSQVMANVQAQKDALEDLRFSAQKTYSDIYNEMEKYIVSGNNLDFFNEFFHIDEMDEIRGLLNDFETGALSIEQITNNIASRFGIDTDAESVLFKLSKLQDEADNTDDADKLMRIVQDRKKLLEYAEENVSWNTKDDPNKTESILAAERAITDEIEKRINLQNKAYKNSSGQFSEGTVNGGDGSDSSGSTSSEEVDQYQKLLNVINQVKEAVDEKTAAFTAEQVEVDRVVEAEILSLSNLYNRLVELENKLNEIINLWSKINESTGSDQMLAATNQLAGSFETLKTSLQEVEKDFLNILNYQTELQKQINSTSFSAWLDNLNNIYLNIKNLHEELSNINDVINSLNTNLNSSSGGGKSNQKKFTIDIDTSDIVKRLDVIKLSMSAQADNIVKAIKGLDKTSHNNRQKQISDMKSTLSQFLKAVSDHNNQKDKYGSYTDQELTGQLLSDGTIYVGHGEDGSVPWKYAVEGLLADLSKSFIMDIHSHPWGEFYDYESGNSKMKFANDSFSGTKGDLSAFRTSRDLGAQLASMITGNILHVFDLSKISEELHDQFVTELARLEKSYAKDSRYSDYVGYDEYTGSSHLIGQDSLEGWHKVSNAFNQMMREALFNTGFSDFEINDIYKSYNLTEDLQLEQLAIQLVDIANAASVVTDKTEQLVKILQRFGGNIYSEDVKTSLEAFKKGEISAADVINRHTKLTVSQDTIDSQLKINAALDDSKEVALLSSISGSLDSIDSKLSSIETNTSKSFDDKFKIDADSITHFLGSDKHNDDYNYLLKNYKSNFNPNNITEYSVTKLFNSTEEDLRMFADALSSKSDEINSFDIQMYLNRFMSLASQVRDVKLYAEAYENKFGNDILYDSGNYMFGLQDMVDDTANSLLNIIKNYFQTQGLDNNRFDNNIEDTNLISCLRDLSNVLDSLLSKLNSGRNNYYGDPIDKVDFSDTLNSLDISSEIADCERLIETLQRVKIAINDKTDAFRNEAISVEQFSEQEVVAIKNIEDYIVSLKNAINELFNFTHTGDGMFDTWKSDLIIIDQNIQNILNNLQNISSVKITNDSSAILPKTNSTTNHGDYALETTLQGTNSILELIFDVLTSDDNNKLANALEAATKELQNVANGIVQHQKKQQTNTSDATNRISDISTYKQISDIAKSTMLGLSDAVEIEGLTALKDGIVKVDGAFKNADGTWEGFSIKVNKANEAIDLSIKKQSEFAKALNNTSAASENATDSDSDNTTSKSKKKDEAKGITQSEINKLQSKYNELEKRAQPYVNQGSNIVGEYIKDYKKRLNDLITAQQKFNAIQDKTSDEANEAQVEITMLKSAYSKCGQVLNAIINQSEKFASKGQNIKTITGVDVDDVNAVRDALEQYVNSQYRATASNLKFDESTQKLTFTAKDANGVLNSFIAELDATGTMAGITASRIDQSESMLNKFGKALKSKAGELVTYATARFGIDEIFQQVRNGIQYVRDIDAALTELKKVTDETDASYARFLNTMSNTAGKIGSTVADLTTMAAEWARLGYSMQEAGKLAESTAILLNVSEFQDATAASEALISTMQAFQYTADESQHVVDILNEVGNNYAVSSDGIATALQDSASALMEGGNNLEQAVALVAAANKVVQDPNSVGSALRTISLRLRGTSVEILEEMGEETDGVAESTSKLQEQLKALTGVDILTDAGSYKDTYTILKEIGAEWENISDIDKAATLELMAGKNRANTLSAILSNMEDLEGAYEDAMKAEGSALKENEAYLDSIQGRIDLFTNALQTMWMHLIDSSAIKGIVDMGTGLIKLFDTLYGKIILLTSGFAIYERFSSKTTFTEMFNGTVGVFKEIGTAIKSTTSGTELLTAATLEQTIATKTGNEIFARRIITEVGLTGVTSTLTKEQVKNAAATLTASYKNNNLTTSQYLATMSTMGLKTALQGLWNVLTKNPVYIVAAAVTTLALAFDHFHTTAQEASDESKEAFDEIKSIVESTKSTIQSLESELDKIQDKIDELNGKQLSFAEEQELEKLKNQREELEHSIKIQQQLLELQRKSSNEQAVTSMKAYTKAASEGAKETQETAKSWGKIIGAIAGVGLAAWATGGLSLVPTIAGAAAGGFLGDKGGEVIGSTIVENEGTYDSWYDTYTKALKTAREEEEEALKDYQQDSDDIDKLDEWQEAQKKVSDIETEMYDSLSQMQQYYNGIEYGQGFDEELDAWYNFLDKFSIAEGASGAEVTALDRIFGENASDEIKIIKDQILDAIKNGEDFDFNSAINGCDELSGILDYINLDVEDVKNYFTQVAEQAKEAAKSALSYGKSYSSLQSYLESASSSISILNEATYDNIELSQEQYDAIHALIGSEEDFADCFDTTNSRVVKNTALLKKLVDQKKKEQAADVRLSKSQAQLQYLELYKKIRVLTNGQSNLTTATRNEVNALYDQMNAIEKTIAKYSMLEAALLGATNAFTEFENAQAIDGETDYVSKIEDMSMALGQAFNTADLGSETAQAAIKGLVPESVYEDLDTVDEKLSAIHQYFKKGKLSQYIDIQFNEDGAIESSEIKLGNVRKFIEDGLAEGIFKGDDWQHFDLSEDIETLDEFCEKMNVTKEFALAMFDTIEKKDGEWLNGDYSTLLDKLIIDSSAIDTIKQQMQEKFSSSPIDFTVRPKISRESMIEAGYTDYDGDYSTVYTETIGSDELGMLDKNGQKYYINVTPILPNGDVIKNGQIVDWIKNEIAKGKNLEELDVYISSHSTISEAEGAAEELHVMQENYDNALANANLTNDIMATTSALAELEHKMANGKITAKEYGEQYSELMKQQADQTEKANNKVFAYIEKSADANQAIEAQRQEVSTLTTKLNELNTQYKEASDQGLDTDQLEIDIASTKSLLDQATQKLGEVMQAKYALGSEPTVVEVQTVLANIEQQKQEIQNKLGENPYTLDVHYEFNEETQQYDVKAGIDKTPELQEYIDLINDEHTLNVYLGNTTIETQEGLDKVVKTIDDAKLALEALEKVEPDVNTDKIQASLDDVKTKAQEVATAIAGLSKTITIEVEEKYVAPSTTSSSGFVGGGGGHYSFVNGTAHASGSWGLPRAEHNSLVGELGTELVVDPHSGRYYTVGDNGAEFVDLPKNAIIFNHKQTESLLSKGHVGSRGKAYAEGNAHVTIFAKGSSKDQWEGTGYSGPDDPTWDAAEALSDAAGDISDATKETIDFIEIKLEEIESDISKYLAELELVPDNADPKNLSKKDSYYDDILKAEKEKAQTYYDAAYAYSQKAADLLKKIPEKYRDMAKNGAIAIADFVGDDESKTAEAINNYREYATKAEEMLTSYYETQDQIAQHRLDSFQDIADGYENEIGLIEKESSLLEAQMDLVEESGKRLGESYYNALIKNSTDTISYLERKSRDLQSVLDESVASGDIKKGTNEWYEMVDAILSVDEEIINCEKDIESFQNAINDLKWDNLEKLINRFGAIDSELSHLYDRFTENDEVIDDDGNWTDESIAAMGVAAQQMELAQYQAKQYADAIDDLKKNWKKWGYSEDEYNEKLAELVEKQWESIDAYEDAEDAIKDLNKARVDAVKDGLDKELDAYKELIEKQKELLDAEKEAYDFEKSIQEQTKDIAELKRKLAALNGDTSASAAAQRKKIQAELLEAEAKLEETYYEKSIDAKKDALDESLEYHENSVEKEKEALDESLKDEEKIITDSMNAVKNNANIVLNEIKSISKQYGIDISSSITQPWKNGVNAISGYKDSFSDLSDSFAKEIDKIIAEEDRLAREAEKAAKSATSSLQDKVSGTTNNNRYNGSSGSTNNNNNKNNNNNTPVVENKPVAEPAKTIKVGGKINAGSAKIYDYVGDTSGERQAYRNDPIYVVLAEKNGYLKVRHHKLSSGVTGFFKKSDVQAYAKGTLGVPNDQWAWIDEVGEELVMHAGPDGKLSYLTKGSSVIPHDLTEKLMDLVLDPTQSLENSRPVVNAPHITNNEINIDASIAELIHIDSVTNDTLPNFEKVVEKQIDKYIKGLNAQIRKFTR